MQIYNKEKRRAYLAEWKILRISGKEFCRQKDIKPSTFYSWLKIEKQLKQKTLEGQTGSFVKVEHLESPKSVASSENIILEAISFKLHIPVALIHKALPAIISAFGDQRVS